MRQSLLCLALAIAAPAAWAAVPAAAPEAETRLVAFELRDGDRLFATPTVALRLGEPASIAMSGPQGYRIELLLERPGPDTPHLLRTAYYRPAGEGWFLIASPTLAVEPGRQARVTLDRPPAPAWSIAVTVR